MAVSQDKVKEYYDNYVPRQRKSKVNLRHQSILEKCKTHGLKPHHTVLEIGCGIGTLTVLLARYLKKGSLSAIDISEKSIEAAKAHTSRFSNTRCFVHNLVEESLDKTFDVVILPDVLEHIPMELHTALFSNISSVLSEDGLVFVHIPNPGFIDWCHQYEKESLQVIDQAVHSQILLPVLGETGFYFHFLQTYSIWRAEGDYRFMVLKRSKPRDYRQKINLSLLKQLKMKIWAWWNGF